MSKREEVVSIARGCLGVQSPDRFWRVVQPTLMGQPTRISWCGGFCLWALRTAGICDWDWIVGKGFLFRLPITIEPEPGDMAYFKHLQHHAIVERVSGGVIDTIDGNQGPGEQVLPRRRQREQVTAFYSIAPLLPESERFTGNEVPTEPALVSNMPTLRHGAEGAAVKLLQERLTYFGWPLSQDGKWGTKTGNAVYNFQLSRGLVADGVVGRKTWALLLREAVN